MSHVVWHTLWVYIEAYEALWFKSQQGQLPVATVLIYAIARHLSTHLIKVGIISSSVWRENDYRTTISSVRKDVRWIPSRHYACVPHSVRWVRQTAGAISVWTESKTGAGGDWEGCIVSVLWWTMTRSSRSISHMMMFRKVAWWTARWHTA